MNTESLEDRWYRFEQSKEKEHFYAYLEQFVRYFSAAATDDDHRVELTQLPDGLLNNISKQLCSYENVEVMDENDISRVLLILQCLKLLSKNRLNIALIASLSFCNKLYELASPILLQGSNGDRQKQALLSSFIEFLEKLYDPYSIWQKRVDSNYQGSGGEHEPAAVDGLVISLIWEAFDSCNLDMDMMYKLIHLLGCIISGSQRNAMMAICLPIVNVLCRALEVNDLFVLKTPCGLRRNIHTCFIWIVHTLHHANPDERQIEIGQVVDKYLLVVEQLKTETHILLQNHEPIVPLFNTLEKMVKNQRDMDALKASFLSVNIFRRLVELISCFHGFHADSTGKYSSLAEAFVDCLREFLFRTPVAKGNFLQTVGYECLLSCLQSLGQPNRELIIKLFNMVVENDFTDSGQTIVNGQILKSIILWLPDIRDENLRVEIAKMLLNTCTYSEKNIMTSCENGAISAAIKVLENPTLYIHSLRTAGLLFTLIERLGIMSISAAEMKQIVSLLNHDMPSSRALFRTRVLQTLVVIADQRTSGKPLYYFCLPNPNSAIDIPTDRTTKSVKSGFTFHCWICVPSSNNFLSFRRVLYSIQSGNGGFEAFFNSNGELQVAVHVFKENFYVFTLDNMKLTDGRWHLVDIVHAPKWKISVYIDGKLVKTCQMTNFDPVDRVTARVGGPVKTVQYHGESTLFSETRPVVAVAKVFSKIGGLFKTEKRADDDVMRVESGHEHVQFGMPVSIHGNIGTVCLLKSVLTDKQIKRLYDKGADCMEIFRDDSDLKSLTSELVFHFNAKMCQDRRCVDLSGIETGNDGTLIEGHTCSTHRAKEMIQCVGGLQVFIPLLERVSTSDDLLMTTSTLNTRDLFNTSAPFESRENNIAGLFHILRCYMEGSDINQDQMLKTNSFATIGALLQQVDRPYMNEFTFMAIQKLLDAFTHNPSLRNAMLQYLMFDFRVWKNCNSVVRVAQAQYILTAAKDDKKYFRHKFGIQFLLDSIRDFCCDGVENSDDDIKEIRSSLFSLMKFYAGNNIRKEELLSILAFIHTVTDYQVVKELLGLLQRMLDSKDGGDQIYLKMYENDAALLLYDLLVKRNPQNSSDYHKDIPLSVKHAIMKIIVKLISSSKVGEASKRSLRLEEYGIAGLVSLMNTSAVAGEESLCLSLMDVVLVPNTRDVHYGNLLSVVSMAHNASNQAKLAIAKKLSTTISEKSNASSELVSVRGWQDCVASLLRKPLKEFETFEELNDPCVEITVDDTSEPFTLISIGEETSGYADDSTDQGPYSSNVPVVGDEPLFKMNPPLSHAGPNASLGSITAASSRSASVDLLTGGSSSNLSSMGPLNSDVFDEVSYFNGGETANHMCEKEDCTECDIVDLLESEVLQIHTQLMWIGLSTTSSMQKMWIERLKVFQSLRSDKLSLLVHQVVYQRKLIENLLELCTQEVQDVVPAEATGAHNGLELIKLVRDFTHTYLTPAGASHCLSDKMLGLVITLLNKMAAWHPTAGWEEVANNGLDVLLTYACSSNLILCSHASSVVNQLIQGEEGIDKQTDIFYIIYVLNSRIKQVLSERTELEIFSFLLQIMKSIFIKHPDMLEIRGCLPNLPQIIGNPRLEEDFRMFFTSEEWQSYITQVVEVHRYVAVRTYREYESHMMNTWNDVEAGYTEDFHLRSRTRGESILKFKSQVCKAAKERADMEKKRYAARNNSLEKNTKLNLLQWKSKRNFFTSSRGAWADREESPKYWKMSTHENFSRMRLKLIENDQFDPHTDASYARDHSEPVYHMQPDEVKLGAPALKDNLAADEDESLFDTTLQDNHAADKELMAEKKEELVYKTDCELILMMDPIPGRIEITTKNVYFFDKIQQADRIGTDFSFPLTMLRDIHCRLRNLQRTALEFFLLDQTNYFINFTKDTRKVVLRHIRSLKMRMRDYKFKIYGNSRDLSKVLKDSDLTNRWVRREISNFDYLMQLNTIAGRTYNDWSQYPVFPWVLADYHSDTLNFDDPLTFRNLGKPAGALNPKVEEELRTKFNDFEDPGGMPKFHHGSHYSSAGGVVTHFLVRVEPFTSQHISLQSGRFDVADRLFFSIKASFESLLQRADDSKELTPDFYCLPEFLQNMNGFDLGLRQAHDGGTRCPVGDVVLPRWASSPDDFIWQHRQALESEYVSANLHNWIDLIFGYKQRGLEAEEACNVFHAYTYEGMYDIERMDPRTKSLMEKFISEFGQTPVQLLKDKHPKRMSSDEYLEQQIKENKPVNILPFLAHIRFYQAPIYNKKHSGNAILVCVPNGQPKFAAGAPHDTLVTISDKGVVGLHKWLPYDTQIINKFDFVADMETDMELTSQRKMLRGPFLPSVPLSHKLLAVSADAEYIYSAGYWDNSMRVYNPRKDSTKIIPAHNGVVTCLSLDAAGEHLITGSSDTTCKIWAVNKQDINEKPVQCLYGHDDEVTCVAISTEYDMAVSGSKDGTVNIHTVRKGLFMHTLLMPGKTADNQVAVQQLTLSHLGHLIAYTEKREQNSKQVSKSLELYTLNARHLKSERIDKTITQMITAQDYLIYGTLEGYIVICEIFNFKLINRMKLGEPILCIHITYVPLNNKYTHILVGLQGCPSRMLVAVRDVEPQHRTTIVQNIQNRLSSGRASTPPSS